MLTYRRNREPEPGADRSAPDLITRCLDKRTGREIVFDEQVGVSGGGFRTIDTRPDDKVVEIVLPTKTLRLQYSR
jgi:hypothetical protein